MTCGPFGWALVSFVPMKLQMASSKRVLWMRDWFPVNSVNSQKPGCTTGTERWLRSLLSVFHVTWGLSENWLRWRIFVYALLPCLPFAVTLWQSGKEVYIVGGVLPCVCDATTILLPISLLCPLVYNPMCMPDVEGCSGSTPSFQTIPWRELFYNNCGSQKFAFGFPGWFLQSGNCKHMVVR